MHREKEPAGCDTLPPSSHQLRARIFEQDKHGTQVRLHYFGRKFTFGRTCMQAVYLPLLSEFSQFFVRGKPRLLATL